MKFSIVIPCYNVEAFVAEALDSVLAQTERHWEAICIDDGSVDGTGTILDDYARGDARIRVIHKKNEGVSAARNDAIRVATGDYVCFLDGDDVWDPGWLARMAEASQEGRADIVRMQFTFWREDRGEGRPTCSDDAAVRLIEGEESVFAWGWMTYVTEGYICLNAFRRELLEKNNLMFPVGMRINEDIIFDLSVLPFAKCAVQCSYAGYFYRMRSTSAWHSKRPIEGCTRYLEESIALWKSSRKQLEGLGCLPQLRRNETFMFYCAILQWFDFGLDEERCRANEVAKLLREAHRQNMLDLKAIPAYWRPAFLMAAYFGAFGFARLTYAALDFYHMAHKRLLRLKK